MVITLSHSEISLAIHDFLAERGLRMKNVTVVNSKDDPVQVRAEVDMPTPARPAQKVAV